MAPYILLALLNGLFIGTSRAINGKLSTRLGPFKASLWNHGVGFLFLTLLLVAMGGWRLDGASTPPWSAYLGGFFGALFVAVNSHVFTRLGAMNAVLLVIGGQMIAAVLLDAQRLQLAPSPVRCLGVGIVLLGIHLTRVSNAPRTQAKTHDTPPMGR
ncbi:DMT family transporter [Myxococcus sp. K38C18041901]|uniref:DMT family transporter n=1 Tax=Myxococcus guangdongensis TaxID=2906760 RepID=UPI0020A7EB84|nr:DMT family transporter [Myxococcus guangdongensis]MCP3061443.1 DMT family transporter [Myxococcus guangdongensis]